MADGYRDSAQSWADLLHDAGAACAPVLAVGDGAFCFWKALAVPRHPPSAALGA
ncbi:hypothetical protein ABZV51_41710 [Streptomyces avermitilis]